MSNTPRRVLDRQTQLHEDGRVRIGHKVSGKTQDGREYTRPAMLDKFRLTTSNRIMLEYAARTFGGTVKPWEGMPGQFELYTDRTELRVAVSAAHSLSQSYELWSGGGCVRRCDGEMCHFVTTQGTGKNLKVIDEGDKPCMCDREIREAGTDPKGTCKFKTRLSVMLTELPALGRWRLETSGKMAGAEIPEILSVMDQLGFSNGPVFCILTLTQKEIKKIGQSPQHFVVPVLSLDPSPPSMAALIQSVQASAFAPMVQVPALNGNSAKGIEGGRKPSPEDNCERWLAKIGMTEDDIREFRIWMIAEGIDMVKTCHKAREMGSENMAEVYEAIKKGMITRLSIELNPFEEQGTPAYQDRERQIIKNGGVAQGVRAEAEE